jgi:hypothetical protein
MSSQMAWAAHRRRRLGRSGARRAQPRPRVGETLRGAGGCWGTCCWGSFSVLTLLGRPAIPNSPRTTSHGPFSDGRLAHGKLEKAISVHTLTDHVLSGAVAVRYCAVHVLYIMCPAQYSPLMSLHLPGYLPSSLAESSPPRHHSFTHSVTQSLTQHHNSPTLPLSHPSSSPIVAHPRRLDSPVSRLCARRR